MAQSFIDKNSLPPEFCFSLFSGFSSCFSHSTAFGENPSHSSFRYYSNPEKMPLLLLVCSAFGYYCSYHHPHIDFPFISV